MYKRQVIDFAKLKTHVMAGMTCAVKNFFGVIPGTKKPEFHYMHPNTADFCDMLCDLAAFVKPRLTLVDAVPVSYTHLSSKLGCDAVIHMDPVSPDGTKTAHMRDELAEAAKSIDPRLSIHDFRIVDGPTHTNVIFDAVLPNDSKLTEEEAVAQLEALVHSLWQNSHPKVHIDRPFV